MGTAAKRHTVAEIVDRAKGYGMKSKVVNGMDVFSVYEAMKEVADDVRENSEPYFLEIRTYRYRGHSMSDPQKYRTKEELETYQDKVEDEVLEAVDFADNADFPEKSALYDDMFAEEDPYFHN
jgi:pyruvate dehydrogenase E1 component alpha subunit